MGLGVAIAYRHPLIADMSPFGQDNSNHIFVPIGESLGSIDSTVER